MTPDALPELKARPAGPPLFALEAMSDLDLRVHVPLGRIDMPLRELLALETGSVLSLDTQTGETLAIIVNGTPVARGEIRVHGERFAVRIIEVLHAGAASGEEDGSARVESANHQLPQDRSGGGAPGR